MRYQLRVDAVVEGRDFSDALRRIGEHFYAWADDTPDEDPDTWRTDASLAAPQLDGSVHLVPLDD